MERANVDNCQSDTRVNWRDIVCALAVIEKVVWKSFNSKMLFSNGSNSSRSGNDFKRLSVNYEDLSKRFHFQAKNDYSKQYAHIYAARLSEMRALLTQRAKAKWGMSFVSIYSPWN